MFTGEETDARKEETRERREQRGTEEEETVGPPLARAFFPRTTDGSRWTRGPHAAAPPARGPRRPPEARPPPPHPAPPPGWYLPSSCLFRQSSRSSAGSVPQPRAWHSRKSRDTSMSCPAGASPSPPERRTGNAGHAGAPAPPPQEPRRALSPRYQLRTQDPPTPGSHGLRTPLWGATAGTAALGVA